jgi:ribosomal protein L28
MPKTCDTCGKGPHTKISRSHSHIATKKMQYPNLQSKKIEGKKMTICTRCLKSLTKTKA